MLRQSPRTVLSLALVILLLGVSQYWLDEVTRSEESQDASLVEPDDAAAANRYELKRGLQPDGLYYNFEEGHGNTARDLSTSGGNDGTLNGEASFTNDAKVGRHAVSFSANWQAYVKLDDPNDNLHQSDGYTFMAWVKINGNGYAGLVMLGGCCNRRNGYTFQIAGSGIRFWGGCDQDTNNYNTNGNRNVGDNQWHHIAISCSPSQLKIYIDGDLISTGRENLPTTPRTGGDSNRNSPVMVIGGDNVDRSCQVSRIIDEVAVFGRELSQEEIREAMQGLSSIPGVQDLSLRNPSRQGSICYARHEQYNLLVNVSTTDSLSDVGRLEVYMDYNTTNATFGYDWGGQRFYKMQDTEGHIELLREHCGISNDGVEKWYLNFTFMINFTFPHERWVNFYANTTSTSGEYSMDFFPWVFKVENDMELLGDVSVEAEHQGPIEEGNWVQGNERLTFRGPHVVYEDSGDLVPDDAYFDIRLSSDTGAESWENDSAGSPATFDIPSSNASNPNETFEMRIVGIPGGGICKTNLSFSVKVDADAPLPPSGLTCHAESYNGRETRYTNEPRMFVTWDEATDNGSGLLGYYHSPVDNAPTSNGTLVDHQKILMEDLAEGRAPVHVWCVDNVGNIGPSTSSGILVDRIGPVFSNFLPEDGCWHNDSKVICSVDVSDPNGSGVDDNAVNFAVSIGSRTDFSMWIGASATEKGDSITANIEYDFQEGVNNYIKWRAKDLVGNDFVESPIMNIKIDTNKVSFSNEISSEKDWYSSSEITVSIVVHDEGTGVDLDSLEARVSTEGPDDNRFGPWMSVSQDDIHEMGSGDYEVSFTTTYGEGKDNYVYFRGYDLGGNPPGLSQRFNLRVDTTPVYFDGFSPEEVMAFDDIEVECFILAFDDGVGVDPTTVEYSISTDGPDENKFGDWNTLTSVGGGNPVQATVKERFDWGSENYIRFRALDKLGNGPNASASHRIWCNSVPEVEMTGPPGRTEYPWDAEIELNASASYDPDGDELSFYWTSNRTENASLGHGPSLKVRLAVGNHTITVYVDDGHGNNLSRKIKVDITPKKTETVPGKTPALSFAETEGDLPWLRILIGSVLVLLVLILVIFLIARSRKKRRKKDGPTNEHFSSPGFPAVSPYRQGGYMQGPAGGYSAPYNATPLANQSFGVPRVDPGNIQAARPMLPPGPIPCALPPRSAASGEPTLPSYMLPTFNTSTGTQDLNLMALPAAPGGIPGAGHPTSPPPLASPSTPRSASPVGGATPSTVSSASPSLSQASSIGPTPDVTPSVDPSVMEESKDRKTGEGAVDPLSELEDFLLAFGSEASASVPPGMNAADANTAGIPASESPLPDAPEDGSPAPPPLDGEIHEPAPPDAPHLDTPPSDTFPHDTPTLSPTPTPTPTPASGNDAPANPPASIVQCHACGQQYSVEIPTLPTVVTCPFCGQQGLME